MIRRQRIQPDPRSHGDTEIDKKRQHDQRHPSDTVNVDIGNGIEYSALGHVQKPEKQADKSSKDQRQ